jgi:hypothetical protein
MIRILDRFGTDPCLGEKLDQGAEDVMNEFPLMAIEVIEEGDRMVI